MTATILYDNHTVQWADLAPRMVEFTKFKLFPIKPVVTQDIHSALMSTTETWAVVFAAGNVVHKPGIIYDIVRHCEQENAPLAGHILHQNGYYNLHPQFFCVNVEVYKQWAKGLEPLNDKIVVKPVERSSENVHDDYTPVWVRPVTHSLDFNEVPDAFASRFISWLIDHGHQIINVPNEIRVNKSYSYVDYNHEDLRMFLKDTTHASKQSGANQFLDYIKNNLDGLSRGFYPVNTESMTKASSVPIKLGVFAGVCGGIKPALIVSQEFFDNNTQIILFDISQAAIEWQQWLRQHWDGRRDTFETVFENFKTASPHALPQFFGHMGILGNLDWILKNACTEQEFVSKWQYWCELEVEYHRLDLLNNPDQDALLSQLSKFDRPAYVWTSNLFLMDWQVLMHEPGQNRRSLDNFINKLQSFKQPVVLENENYLQFYKI